MSDAQSKQIFESALNFLTVFRLKQKLSQNICEKIKAEIYIQKNKSI